MPFPEFVQTQERRLSSADVIVEDGNGRALVVKTSYLPHWSFPGGIIDAGESPIEAAVRELGEETNLHFGVQDVEFFSVIHRNVLDVDMYVFVFRLKNQLKEPPHITIDQHEIIAVDWVSKEDVQAKARGHYNIAIRNWANSSPQAYVDHTSESDR